MLGAGWHGCRQSARGCRHTQFGRAQHLQGVATLRAPASTAQPAVAPAARLPTVMRHCGTPSRANGLLSTALATTNAGTLCGATLLSLAVAMLTLAKGAADAARRARAAGRRRRSLSSAGQVSSASSNSSSSTCCLLPLWATHRAMGGAGKGRVSARGRACSGRLHAPGGSLCDTAVARCTLAPADADAMCLLSLWPCCGQSTHAAGDWSLCKCSQFIPGSEREKLASEDLRSPKRPL